MTRLSKTLFIAAATIGMSSVAFAQDGGDAAPAGDATTTEPAPATTPEPAPAGGEMAPAANPKAKTLGADVVAVLPIGDYADLASFAIGALGRFELGINANLAVTARAGFIYNLAKDQGGVTPTVYMIPVMAGVRYNIGTSGLFADGEVGINYSHVSVSGFSDSTTKLTFQVGPGYQKGKIEARAGLWYTATDPASMAIMASVGFNFASM